jgi:hypothetical protein
LPKRSAKASLIAPVFSCVKQPLAALLTVMSGQPVEESDLAGEAITEKRYAFAVRNLPAVRAEWNSSNDTFEAINVELARVREGIEIEGRRRAGAS